MRRTTRYALAASLALTITACSQEPSEGESAEDYAARIGGGSGTQEGPAPAMTGAPAPTEDAQGQKYAEGKWFVTEDAQSARAMFGPPQSEPLLTLSCKQGSGVMQVVRAGAAEAAGNYTISVGGHSASVRLAPTGAELPTLSGTLAASDPVFAAMSRAGQSATVAGAGGESLYIPGSAAIRRVLTACGVAA